jgi:hypothetical protein
VPNRLYSSVEVDREVPSLCEGSVVLKPKPLLLADLTACLEWAFESPSWLIWRPAWAQQRKWSSSWMPPELNVPRDAPARRLDLALRTEDSKEWVFGGEVILAGIGWGWSDAPGWGGNARANFRLASPLSDRYWPRLRHWSFTVDGESLDWTGNLGSMAGELEGDWREVELSRRCGDALNLKRTRGRVFVTYTSPGGAKGRCRSDYDWLGALMLFSERNLLLPTAEWRWSGDAASSLVRIV